VNDGSFREEDMVLEELSSTYPIVVLAQANSGLGAARNLGIRQARGRYVFPLDADNLAMPTFVERCVEVLESNEAIPYVTAWSRFVHEEGMRPHWRADGYRPLSNDSPALAEINTAGDAAAVIRRGVFERGFWYSVDGASSYEDWLFYRTLATAGLYGHVVPDYLLVYRVRESSMLRKLGMPHHQRLIGEMEAHVREREVNWTTAN
jgi:glycosyltransferase involved in cell wall biosynthesis